MSADDRFPSDAADRFQVRMPPGLRQRIADEAKANGRSMNAEIVARLQSTFDSHGSEDAGRIIEKAAEKAVRNVFREFNWYPPTAFRVVKTEDGIGLVPDEPEKQPDEKHIPVSPSGGRK